jgi:glycosyltransferase involved in cell wall biosynthesis
VSAAPPVSVGLPVFNGERYLRGALDSLLAQTYVDFELVIGDNGSTDATREICLDAASRDARVRYLPSDENRGAAWNYNRVFHAGTGRYFRWAAYDDLVAPTYLERVVAALDDAPTSTVLAHSLTTFIDEDGEEVGPWDEGFDLSSDRASTRLAQLVRHLIKANVFYGLVRRSAMERTRLHGAYPSADYVLIAELTLLGPFTTVPERLFLRRVHPGMSRLARKGLADVAEWFEPGSGDQARPEMLRLFAEHIRLIASSPIGLGERATTLAVFLPAWLARHRHAMATELWNSSGRRLRERRR